MLLRAVNEVARRIVKLPAAGGFDSTRLAKHEMNAIQANTNLKERITNEAL